MFKLILFCAFLGIGATCIGSPIFWRNLMTQHSIRGTSNRIGLCPNAKLSRFIKYQFAYFYITTIFSFLVYFFQTSPVCFFSWGSLTAIVLIGLSHIWSSGFYTRFEIHNFLYFKIKLSVFFLAILVYILLWIKLIIT